jgi:hypothetical protein
MNNYRFCALYFLELMFFFWEYLYKYLKVEQIAEAARSKAWTVFACLNAGVVALNPTRGMDVFLRLFCVCVVLCVGSGLAMGWSRVQRVLLTVYRTNNWKSDQGPPGL